MLLCSVQGAQRVGKDESFLLDETLYIKLEKGATKMEFIVYEQKGNYGVITISREKELN